MHIAETRKRRTPSLTPMIDVVFLLLVFFMLASRFGMDMQIPLSIAGGSSGSAYEGPPRLVDITAEGLLLNGTAIERAALPAQLSELTSKPSDTIILRPKSGAKLQTMVQILGDLGDAGFTQVVVVE
ncbi:biopolymer transporter ExbD [uncultured Sulfitobacter sp.]|jgi:biopolymer transport protein ExbD|uniref:ExbD/TolR family protein n=1 Tax=uncultured Sulfitobacter sp. TaxID=191468 RepID=UPI0030DD1C39|tara:strand:+ start:153307 stop:153687 length:381 start_codon:yes stop_codon:yes gene_type:complete